jgi:hypothetical protein
MLLAIQVITPHGASGVVGALEVDALIAQMNGHPY